ncbi:MAG: AraC family transcriptional regulator ligand-binding domain-containing protein [Deltaproteobacteria bacterium]|nr:AraC family transcriptional regulator ligand-binding domain-containing protein [Deltaproteobacteria bacterium]
MATTLFALSKGVPMETLTAATGVSAEALLEADPWLPGDLVARIWQVIRTRCPNDAVGLRMASMVPRSILGEFGELSSTLPDLRSLTRFAARNHALLSDELELEVFEGPHESGIRMYHPMDELDGGCGAELGVGVAAQLATGLFGADVIRRVEFRHHPLGPESQYAEFFGQVPLFGAPTNALIVLSSDLDRPNPHARPELHLFVQQRLDALRAERQTVGPPERAIDLQEAVAFNAAHGDFTARGLARRLGVSERSLQRMASQEGSSPRKLMSDARRAHALRLLQDAGLSMDQIAEQLGYATERSFRRAFERWVGKTPAQVRRERARQS